jgi:hypothetical protein
MTLPPGRNLRLRRFLSPRAGCNLRIAAETCVKLMTIET